MRPLVLLAALLPLAVAARAQADEPQPAAPVVPAAPKGRTYTLDEALSLADKNHPTVAQYRAKLDGYRAQLSEARTAPFSIFTLTAGAGPAPTFRGGPVYTQDRETGLSSSLGMAWRVGVEGTVPIWTFGKITNTWKAAEAQVELGEAEIRKVRAQIRTDVRKAYYGLLLARSAKDLLGDASERLDKALEKARKKVKDEEGDDIDLLRLETARAELEGRVVEAEKGERVALAALRFLTGKDDFDAPDIAIKPPKHKLREVAEYIGVAKEKRPEIQMAQAGLRARAAQVDLAKSRRLPDFGVSLFWSYARAPEITDQFNPFVRDDANYVRYGFAIGMRWTLDFAPATARVRYAEAQHEEVRQLHRFAMTGVSYDVERAYRDAEEAKRKSDAFQRAQKLAKQWMVKVSQGIDVGTMEERDMVDPARQYAIHRYNYLSALSDLNIAMANLAEKTGWDDLAAQGVE